MIVVHLECINKLTFMYIKETMHLRLLLKLKIYPKKKQGPYKTENY